MNKKLKEKITKLNDKSILGQYMVPYAAGGLSRYKHIDELHLEDGQRIKATLGPVDMNVHTFEGHTPYVVPEYEANRLDIIAYKFYGKASMYWALAYATGLKDPLNVPEGTMLLIPSLATLKRFPNPLS